jgi:hypothetical protein
MRAGNATDDLALLNHATGLPEADASILSLFGIARVDRASAVLVGSGNELLTSTDVHRPGLSRTSIVGDLARIARTVKPPPSPAAPPPATPADPISFRSNLPGPDQRRSPGVPGLSVGRL